MDEQSSWSGVRARLKELRGAWYVALALSFFTYLYLLTQFPMGNHDWARLEGNLDDYQIRLGRWFSPVFMGLTFFKQVPVLNASLAIALYVCAGFIACAVLELAAATRIARHAYAIAGILCAILPFSTWTFYFSWQAAVAPGAQLLCVASFWLVLFRQTLVGAGLSAWLFCFSMATYQATVNTAACMFWAVAIVTFLRYGWHDRKTAARTLLLLGGSVGLGAVLYKVSLSILKAFDVLTDTYHFQFVGLKGLPGRAFELLHVSFGHFWVAHPFFPQELKWGLLGLTLVGVAILCVRAFQSASRVSIGVLGVGLLLVTLALDVYSTKIQFLVAVQDSFYRNRFASFGLTYVYLPFIVLGITYLPKRLERIQVFLSCLVLWACAVFDYRWQDAHVKQNEYDIRVLDRVIARIESLPEFRYSKKYDLAQVGTLENIRAKRYRYEGMASPYHNYNLIPSWAPGNPYRGLEPRLRIDHAFVLDRAMKQGGSKRDLDALVEHVSKSSAWPHPSSVALVDGTIVVIFEKDGWSGVRRASARNKLGRRSQ